MNKGYLEISFGWLFAIVVGVVILFLAIFLSTRLMNLQQTAGTAETGKEIGILLNPLETSFESSRTTSFYIPKETRIYNSCSYREGFFGKQGIQVSQKSFNKWSDAGIDASFENKYIFSEREIEDKKFYVFSKQFNFPFKVADLIYLTSASKSYCFVNPPLEIKEEISRLGQKNLFLTECPTKSINVCFGLTPSCDINVNYHGGYVKKQATNLYFEGNALMYAAVFSDASVYECQVQRLMKRIEQLSLLYREKERIIPESCNSDLRADLITMSNLAGSLQNSESLRLVKNSADVLQNKNDLSACSLW